MDTTGEIKLHYPEDYKIACKINNLKHEDLLQYFIDHVSFYAFIGGDMEPAYLWATTVSIECKSFFGKTVEVVTDTQIQEISLKYVRKLTALNLNKSLSRGSGTLKSAVLMANWASEMVPLTDYQESVHTDRGEQLRLTFDFNLICRMNGLEVRILLQYFIDHISLARERALNLIKTVKTDPSTAVLLILISSHDFKHKVLPQQDIYKRFGLRILKVDKQQKEEKDTGSRLRTYTEFYKEWYDALNRNIN